MLTGLDPLVWPDPLAQLEQYPIGLATAVAAGLLLWPVGARLGLAPASRAAASALYASAAVLVELYAPEGVDGRGSVLLTLAACLAVGGSLRNVAAVLCTAAAVLLSPITAVGFLVLLAAMALAGDLASRMRVAVRVALAVGASAVAAATAVLLARPELPSALPPVVLGVLTVWTLLVTSLLWRRLRWLRPVGASMLAMLACCWVPGPDADAVVIVAAVIAMLTALLAEEFPTVLVRRTLAVAVAAVGLTTVLLAPTGDEPVRTPAAAAPAAPAADPAPAGPAVAPAAAAPVRPVTISIPAMGVDGPLEDLTADPETGELSAPDDPATAGWYAAGVVPGEAGPAVVGGHVDSRAGPGVFFKLRGLQPGDRVEITRSDGRTVSFAVTAVSRYPKNRFPTTAVYGPAPGPELRLVTCGGTFNRTERSYEDNVVVDAVLL